MDARAAHVQYADAQSIRATFPEVPFAITSNDGDDFSISTDRVTLEGTGWVDVARLYRDADPIELEVTWVDRQTWQVELEMDDGANPVTLVATDLWGTVLTTDSITIIRE
jgi:hypothetical protein